MEKSSEILQVYVWVLSGVLGFLITLLIVVGTTVAKTLGKKLDGLLASVQDLTNSMTKQTEQIKILFEKDTDTTDRLNDHAERIRNIEIKCGKCDFSKK